MDRVTRSIVAYVAVIGTLLAVLFLVLPWPPGWRHLVVAGGFLVPGRVQGVLWREFFRGRYAMGQGEFARAEGHFARFLEALRQRPFLRFAAFLAWNFYTWNPEAMTRNNLGGCYLARGAYAAAEDEWKHALELDPSLALPYFNLAILAYARQAPEEAERLRREAARLGYRAATRERLISAAGSALAAVEGRA